MPGLGSIINAAAIAAAGLAGCLMGSRIPSRIQDSLMTANALAVLFLGIGGAMAGMLRISGSSLATHGTVMMVVSLAAGAVIGEIIDLEKQFTRFGEWLKKRTGNAKDQNFVNAFVTASLTVCIGAMAVIGSIQDGMYGDHSILISKYYSGDVGVNGEGMCLFCRAGTVVAGGNDLAGACFAAVHDRHGDGEFVLCWFCFDILCRR